MVELVTSSLKNCESGIAAILILVQAIDYLDLSPLLGVLYRTSHVPTRRIRNMYLRT